MKKRKYCILLFLIFLTTIIYSSAATGTTGAQFLKLLNSARSISMGQAFVSLQNELSALYYNPAGLTLEKSHALFSHTEIYQSIRREDFLFFYKLPDQKGNISVGINLLYLGDILRTNVDANGIWDGKIDNGVYGASDLLVSAAYTYTLMPNLILGTTLKVLNQKIESYSRNGFLFDVGVIYTIYPKELSSIFSIDSNSRLINYLPTNIGLVIKNLGFLGTFSKSSDPPPINIQAGVSKKLENIFRDFDLLYSVDLSQPNDNNMRLLLGTEWTYKKQFVGRLGYRLGDERNFWASLTFGLGFMYKAVKFDYSLDFHNDLGINHIISVSANIGELL